MILNEWHDTISVASCFQVCSQLSQWAALQCTEENISQSTEDSRPRRFSPLSLTNLLSSDELTKFLLLSSGAHVTALENNTASIPITYREGPWICQAFRNLLCDLLKYENSGVLCYSTPNSAPPPMEYVETLFDDGKDVTAKVSRFAANDSSWK